MKGEKGKWKGDKVGMDQRKMLRLKLLITPIFILIALACATHSNRSYEQTVAGWKSYKDVAKWMGRHFSYDMARWRESESKILIPRSPEETFKLQSGLCQDGAFFVEDALNRIAPSYKAKLVFIENRPYEDNHLVCSFRKNGRLFIMDYSTAYRNMIGVHGPYNSLDEYKEFYESNHPKVRHVQSIRYW